MRRPVAKQARGDGMLGKGGPGEPFGETWWRSVRRPDRRSWPALNVIIGTSAPRRHGFI
jgi:hypothetical protein